MMLNDPPFDRAPSTFERWLRTKNINTLLFAAKGNQDRSILGAYRGDPLHMDMNCLTKAINGAGFSSSLAEGHWSSLHLKKNSRREITVKVSRNEKSRHVMISFSRYACIVLLNQLRIKSKFL